MASSTGSSELADRTRIVLAALGCSFFAMLIANVTRPLAAILFAAAVAFCAAATPRTIESVVGPDRLAALAAHVAMASVAIFGVTVALNTEVSLDALSIVVAPTSGLATVWWIGHTHYRDRLRWVPTLVGAGWIFVLGIALTVATFAADNLAAAAGTLLAGLGSLMAFCLIVAGVIGGISRARSRRSSVDPTA